MLRILQRRRNRPDTPVYRSIIVIDIAGSGRWDNQAQLRARAVLHDGLRTALRMAGVDRSGIDIADRGDGMILVIPPEVAKVDLLDPMIPLLSKAIHDHNELVNPRFRIRLRVAIHAGELHNDTHGWVGTDLNTACRLVNGTPLYEQLDRAPETDLVLVVSESIYQTVVRQHYRSIDPAGYTQVQIQSKEVDTTAWLQDRPVRGKLVAIDGSVGRTRMRRRAG